METYEKIPAVYPLKSTKPYVLVAFGGDKIKPEGTLSVMCETPKTKSVLQFFISSQSSTPIVGRESCEALQLVKRIEAIGVKGPMTKEKMIQEYASVFTGLGEFPGVHHIHVDPKIMAVVNGCRKIPLAIMDQLKSTLHELVRANVITPVQDPTDWVNSLVITEKKNGALRVCLDPRELNKAIKRQHFSIPTHDDERCKLAGKSVFTIIDEKDGYWQVKLDESSSMLCTFSTPWGRYHFLRLPFGIKSASEVFQQKNSEVFGDNEGVHIISDDMIIATSSEQEHDKILCQVMKSAKKV